MWFSFMVRMCKVIISPDGLLIVFKIFIFGIVREVKVQKMVQNTKQFCPMCSVSQDPYIMWLSFMSQLCKMIIPPGSFSIFKIFFDFFDCWRCGGGGQGWQKILSVVLHISGPVRVKWYYLQMVFSFFSKFSFLGFLGGRVGWVKGQKMT